MTSGAKVFSRTYFTDSAVPRNTSIEEIAAAGYTPEQAVRVLSTVYNFVVGFTIEQQSVEPMPGDRDQRYDALVERYSGDGSAMAAAVTASFNVNFDKQFEDGLAIVFLGVKAWLR